MITRKPQISVKTANEIHSVLTALLSYQISGKEKWLHSASQKLNHAELLSALAELEQGK